MSDYAIEWIDGHGRSHWQPVTGNGESLWTVSNYADAMHRAWLAPTRYLSRFLVVHGPVTYKSRARAERIARRRQAREEANTLRRIHPVQKKETQE